MKNDLTTKAWQHDIGCPISITLLSTSDVAVDMSCCGVHLMGACAFCGFINMILQQLPPTHRRDHWQHILSEYHMAKCNQAPGATTPIYISFLICARLFPWRWSTACCAIWCKVGQVQEVRIGCRRELCWVVRGLKCVPSLHLWWAVITILFVW